MFRRKRDSWLDYVQRLHFWGYFLLFFFSFLLKQRMTELIISSSWVTRRSAGESSNCRSGDQGLTSRVLSVVWATKALWLRLGNDRRSGYVKANVSCWKSPWTLSEFGTARDLLLIITEGCEQLNITAQKRSHAAVATKNGCCTARPDVLVENKYVVCE